MTQTIDDEVEKGMMKQRIFTVINNERLTPTVYRMKLSGDVSAVTCPGQFINIKLDGYYLRRPISVCDVNEYEITIIYKVLGQGTADMTRLRSGDKLDILTGLGNGYDLERAGDKPLLLGGGVGIPPLFFLARKLREAGKKVTVILGYNSKEEIYYVDEFRKLGCEVKVATADGSRGTEGTVIDAFNTLDDKYEYTHYFACGPMPMLEATYSKIFHEAGIFGQLSFEERMGCGFGACMGCSIMTKSGYKRVCKDGPVFSTEEGVW